MEDEETFDGIANRPVSEDRPASTIQLTLSRSSARLENTVHNQYASIRAVVDDTVLRLFDDARRAKESSTDTKALEVLRIVFNRSVAKAFQSSLFQSALERATQKCLAEPHVANDVATCILTALHLRYMWLNVPERG